MDAPSKRRPGELVFCLVLLVFSVTAFWQAVAISGFVGMTTPGVFPMLASGTMIVASLAILVDAARRYPPDPPIARRFLAEVTPRRHLLLIGMVALYLVAMPYIGFVASSGLFLFASFQFLWKRHAIITLLLTVGTMVAIYLVFREVFQVVLPQGIWVRGLF